ncbi:U3 small nucleolar RNA-associated protein 25 [Fistulifera solaris]|uniref:U3 small nucleolar RNA-associated protein 25 n=1 Tax=Fistulifera solaris TaxID=1519565 RepID=A0A1Z5JJ38_FISSO|nr:U3 small nucleolar RNA-associated protein 25 [Fistulifera solaris]|eukprot:GAX14004.1 U3 small nucleolar RNA-associated protein 25 [Fistulifera solaris]
MAKKTNQKKKGPKGKKARAKAKLERQWGEQPSQEAELRKGKSRLLKETTKQPERTISPPPQEEQPTRVRDFSDEEAENDDDGRKAFSSLLDTIQRKTGVIDHDSDSENEENNSIQRDITTMKDKMDSDSDKEDVDFLTLSFDPFTERFGRAELPEVSHEKVKFDMARYCLPVDPDLEVQHTEKLDDDLIAGTINSSMNDSSSDSVHWKSLAFAFQKTVRDSLRKRWEKLHPGRITLDQHQTLLTPFMLSYSDVLWMTADAKEERDSTEALAALHAVNHVMTSRIRILRHNKQIKELEEDGRVTADEKEDLFRDQGFSRPTVLILLPTRGCCYSFLKKHLLPLLGDSPSVEKMDRFEAEYGKPEIEDDEEVDLASKRRRQRILAEKGSDWRELFDDDINSDDDFRLALSINPKGGKRGDSISDTSTTVKLFTDFFRSDIIIASPLGLKMTAASESGDFQADYLSSIEICLVSRADVLMMQNWDHVNDVLSLLNEQPNETNETDFSRVRPYFLDGHSAKYRQIIMLAPFMDPFFASSFKRHATSWKGQVRFRRRVAADAASISNVLLPTQQIFQRVSCSSAANQTEDRLKYFVNVVLPQINKPSNKQKHTLIYVPSYFDYIALRNALLKRELEPYFVSVTEYSRTSEITRGRARFLQGRKPWMLYTGRANFFLRHKIKGARHIIFYGIPEHPEFYPEHVNLLNEGLEASKMSEEDPSMVQSVSASCLVLFTKFEAHALERVVGSANCSKMVKGEKTTFLFST